MLFNSIEFLIFLPLVFFGYWFAFKSLRWQNLFVVAVSYLFYGWWDWRFFAADPVYVVMQLLEWSLFGEMRWQPVGPKVDKCRQYFTEPFDLGCI